MPETRSERGTCSVYRGHGESVDVVPLPAYAGEWDGLHRASSHSVPLHRIVRRDLICATADLDLKAVIHLFMRYRIGCLPVIDEHRRPVGIITKHDLLEQLDAAMTAVGADSPLPEDLQPRCADEVMMPLALSLSEVATVADAASLMIREDTHHALVVAANGELVGVVSSKDIVSWLHETDGAR